MTADSRTVRILKKLFSLEVMAVQIYRTQVGAMVDAEERSIMVAAMENEEYHRQTLRSLLKARGVAPSPGWPFFWLMGQTLGRTTSIFGRKTVLKADITFEDKASREYAGFIKEGDFTDQEMTFLSEFLEDEKRHSANWRGLLEGSGNE